jgi:heptose I phosphotransferase
MSRYEFIIEESSQLLEKKSLSSMDAFFAWQEGQRLDKAGLESWRQRWRIELDGQVFYLKRFMRPPLKRQWGRWREGRWRRSTAGVEWDNCRALKAAGVSAAEAAAFGEELAGVREQRSFILLREVPGQSLERWMPQHWRQMCRDFPLCKLAELVARFHACGFAHRDLYLSHIFINDIKAGRPFALIDLQRVFQPRWRKLRWVVKDLAALHYSTPDTLVGRWTRLRFLCHYVRHCPRFGTARKLAKRVGRKTSRMERRLGKV